MDDIDINESDFVQDVEQIETTVMIGSQQRRIVGDVVRDNSTAPTPLEINTKYKKSCCPENTFGFRLYTRLKLDHLLLDNAPGFVLIKSIILCIITLLIDRGTRNPDSVSTVFVGLLGLSPFLQNGKKKATNTLFCGLLGACVGTLVNAACYLPPESDPHKWMQLLTVPLSVGLTQYILFFVGLDDQNSKSTGQFSALFVVLVQYAYPPISDIVPQTPRILIWQTLLVRVLALLTAVVSSFLINVIISASVPLSIYKAQQYIAERFLWDATSERRNPTDQYIQKCFSQVVKQIELAPDIKEAAKLWVFGDSTRDLSLLIEKRAKAMFRYITFRSFLELYIESIESNHEERELLLDVLEKSKRDKNGNSIHSLEESIRIFEALPVDLHVIKVIFIDILHDLHNSVIPYRDRSKINLFLGLT